MSDSFSLRGAQWMSDSFFLRGTQWMSDSIPLRRECRREYPHCASKRGEYPALLTNGFAAREGRDRYRAGDAAAAVRTT